MNYRQYVYFDIETAGKYPDLETLKNQDKIGYNLFLRKIDRKSDQFKDWKEVDPNDVYKNKVSLIPEFGKVVCVSVGIIKEDEGEDKFVINSFYGKDEEKIIKDVHKVFNKFSYKTLFGLSGFYIKGFDIPWLNRKFMEYGLEIPNLFKNFKVKPWEMNVLDLAEAWKGYSTLESVSFEEMLYLLDIKSPKEIMKGSEVHDYFWVKDDLEKIKKYCEADVKSCLEAGKKIIPLL